jgi:ABC-type transporter Mla subunit MlaD
MSGKTIFDHIGFIVNYLMELAFRCIDISGFPQAASTLLLFMMLVFVVRCWLNISPTWRRLDICRNKLKIIETPPTDMTGLHEFEAEIVSRSDCLKENWLQYKKTLIHRGRIDCLTALPSDFINLGKLGLEAPLRRFGKWSGLFVGIGLCMTFLGIVAALYAATKAINAATISGENSTEAMQQALKDLLHAASFKFYTSIFGLLASLIVNYMEKYFRRKLENKIGGFCLEIERLLPVVTPEQLLADQVEEAKQTTTQLKQFNSEMREGLIALSGAMDTALHANVDPLRDGIYRVGHNLGIMEQTIGENIGKMQERTLNTLAERLGSVVNDHAGNELNGLAQTLGHLTSSLSKMTYSLEQGSGSFAETLESSVKELRMGITGLSEATNNISKSVNEDISKAQQMLQERMVVLTNELSSRGQEAATHLTEATSTVLGTMQGSVAEVGAQVQFMTVSLQQASQALVSHRQAVNQASSQTQSAAQTIEQASHSLGGATSPMQASVKSLDDSMKKYLEGASTLNSSVRQAETAIRTASESLEQNWKQHVGRFKDLDADLAKILHQITQALNDNTTKVSTYVQEIDDNMGKAVGQFADSLESLNEVFENYLSRLQNK